MSKNEGLSRRGDKRLLQAAHEQEGLVVKLTAEAADCVENLRREQRKGILRTGSDESVQALDTELLSAFVSDFKNAIRGDYEEIAAAGVQLEAVEVRERQQTDGKLGFLKPRDGL